MIDKLSLSTNLSLLKGVAPIEPPSPKQPSATAGGGKVSFGEFLQQSVEEMNRTGLEVDRKIQDHIEGKTDNPHETMIAIQQADVSFRLMLSVKDQIEQAYQTIMRSTIG